MCEQLETTARTLAVQGHLSGDQLTTKTSFTIPYVSWGLKNPNTPSLRVNSTVEIAVHTVGQIKLLAAH
jgi:hypothetical protein